MAEITDPKIYKDLLSAVKSLQKEIKNSDKSVISFNHNITEISKNAKKATKDMEDLEESVSDMGDVFSKISVSKLTREMKDFTSYSKKIDELTKSQGEFQKIMKTTTKLSESLGIIHSLSSKKIIEGSKEATVALKKMTLQSEKFAEKRSELIDLSNVIKNIGEKTEGLDSLSEKINKYNGQIDSLKQGFESLAPATQKTVLKQIKEIENLKKPLMDQKNNIEKFQGSIENLEKSEVFKDIGGDQAKSAVTNLKKILSEPVVDWAKAGIEMDTINKEMEGSFDKLAEKNKEEYDKIKKEMDRLVTEAKNLESNLKKPYELQIHMGDATTAIDDFKNYVKKESIELDVAIPSEVIFNSKEFEEIQKNIKVINDDMIKQYKEIDTAKLTEEEKTQKILELDKNITAQLSKQVIALKELRGGAERNIKVAKNMSDNDFGRGKVKELQESFTKARFRLMELGKEFPKLKGAFEGLGNIAGAVGKAIGGMGIPIVLLEGTLNLVKMLMDVNQQVANMQKEIVATGVGVGVSSEKLGGYLDDTFTKARNLNGVFEAWKGGEAFVTTRKDIMPVIDALTKTGKPLTALEKDLSGITTTAAASGNELLKAADLAKTFGYNLNMSTVEIAKSMGDMMFEFESGAKNIQANFTEITEAAQSSGMSTNRFMGIVQTTTAGLSLYADQVKDTAVMISELGTSTSYSASEIQKIVKGVSETARDSKKALMSLALTVGRSPDLKEKLLKSWKGELIPKLEMEVGRAEKGSKEEAHLKAQLDYTKKGTEALEKGKLWNLSYLMKRMDPKAMLDIQAEQINLIAKQAKGDTGLFEEIAKAQGMAPEMIDALLNTGMDSLSSLDNIKTVMTSNAKVQETYKDQQKKAIELDKYANYTTNELLGTINETLLKGISSISTYLMFIAGAVVSKSIFDIGKALIGMGFGEVVIGAIVKAIASAGAAVAGAGIAAAGAAVVGAVGLGVAGGVLSSEHQDIIQKNDKVHADFLEKRRQETRNLEKKLEEKRQTGTKDEIASLEAIIAKRKKSQEDLEKAHDDFVNSEMAQTGWLRKVGNMIGIEGPSKESNEAMGMMYVKRGEEQKNLSASLKNLVGPSEVTKNIDEIMPAKGPIFPAATLSPPSGPILRIPASSTANTYPSMSADTNNMLNPLAEMGNTKIINNNFTFNGLTDPHLVAKIKEVQEQSHRV